MYPTPLDPHHINEDGTIPCTNACGHNIFWDASNVSWLHDNAQLFCHFDNGGEQACPEAPNDDPEEWTTPMKEKWPNG